MFVNKFEKCFTNVCWHVFIKGRVEPNDFASTVSVFWLWFFVGEFVVESEINSEASKIAKTYKIQDRAEIMAKSPAFISLKDHKDNFHQNHPCRLINPCKSNLGKVTKSILDRINTDLRQKLKVKQWKDSSEVIEWFSSINNKKKCSFIQMDIKEFYPSITKKVLENAISFAKRYTEITDKEISTIMHCRKSLLYFKDEPWKKKDSASCFDVTMGSYDGAELCELVGIFILEKLSKLNAKESNGLYRDDGLMLIRLTSKRLIDKLRKSIRWR